MKANEFVEKFGLDKTKCVINDFENGKYKDCCLDTGLINNLEKSWWDICVYDLKRLVESHELVESKGGIELSKKEVRQRSIVRWVDPEVERLREAIADVEACKEVL